MILRALQRDAKLSTRDVALEVGVSKSAVWERVRRLEVYGFILGYRAIVSAGADAPTMDFVVELELATPTPAFIARFERELRSNGGLLVLGAARVGPGRYQLRLAGKAGLEWIEAEIVRCGLVVARLIASPVMEEIVAYRDPPLSAFPLETSK